MTHPIPPGTRDVLPEEMRELRAIGDRMRAAYEDAGYGEIHTPALEYEEVLLRGDERAAGARYRTFDDQGAVLALRSDMTIPVARVVATRYADAEPPLRFSYVARAWRATDRGVGEPREFLQAGIELIGVPGVEGEAEVVALTIAALDAAGLRRHRVGVGDGALYRGLLSSFGVPEEAHLPMLEALSRRDLVDLEHQVEALGLDDSDRDLLVRLPQLRGGPEVLEDAPGVGGLRSLHEQLEARGVADRVIFDLGLVRELGYYTGAVFEVYDPAVGFTLGGGGRYDNLIGKFGRELPACGLAVDVQRRASRAGRGGGALVSDRVTIAVPRGALFGGTLDLLDGLGMDTSEVRSNDRKLLFADIGVVTMRPSDVPTYVEHGSADIGITGKDVLLEQSERKVYELLDLGYGECEMVVAAPDTGDPIGDALRRLGRVRIATKYPRVAGAHFAETGRQAEIVEVKGSVELAPLTGLVDGIVDLTATGKTLAENNLKVFERITTSTARLIANPVSHKLKATEIDAILERLRR